MLWTPGYWGWQDGAYVWNAAIGDRISDFMAASITSSAMAASATRAATGITACFAYNQTVNNFGGVRITNVYSKTVIVNVNAPRTSFNGGAGGITARPSPRRRSRRA